jgi:propionate CoA-transferase
VPQPSQFDFYDGGGLDIAFLGAGEIDAEGNVNVSKFGPKFAGCGGFINITQNARRVVFCTTFTAGGLKTEAQNGRLKIEQEGRTRKFVKKVEQVTFSGNYALHKGTEVTYVTERGVFKLTAEGLKLIEIAPGVDLEKDILEQMKFKPIVTEQPQLMKPSIFIDRPMEVK